MMLVKLQSSRCFIVNVLLVFVKVTVSYCIVNTKSPADLFECGDRAVAVIF